MQALMHAHRPSICSKEFLCRTHLVRSSKHYLYGPVSSDMTLLCYYTDPFLAMALPFHYVWDLQCTDLGLSHFHQAPLAFLPSSSSLSFHDLPSESNTSNPVSPFPSVGLRTPQFWSNPSISYPCLNPDAKILQENHAIRTSCFHFKFKLFTHKIWSCSLTLEQSFPNFSQHQNHARKLAKTQAAGSHVQSFWSSRSGGWALRISISTKISRSQVMLLLLARSQTLRTTAPQEPLFPISYFLFSESPWLPTSQLITTLHKGFDENAEATRFEVPYLHPTDSIHTSPPSTSLSSSAWVEEMPLLLSEANSSSSCSGSQPASQPASWLSQVFLSLVTALVSSAYSWSNSFLLSIHPPFYHVCWIVPISI